MMTINRIICAVVVSVLWSGNALAWESDVHYGLTKWLALQMGFRPEYAESVATANEKLDRSGLSAIHLVLFYACLSRDERMSLEVRNRHFPSFGYVPSEPVERTVVADSKEAFFLVERELSVTVNSGSEKEKVESLRRFGEALHAFQDSWSHQGLPDTPAGLAGLFCDRKLAWGHPRDRGGIWETWADQTYRWPGDAIATAMRTYKVLETYLEKNPWVKAAGVRSWKDVEHKVITFSKAELKDEKVSWFRSQGFTDLDFLGHTSLELKRFDWSDGITYAGAGEVIAFPKEIMAKADVPKEVSDEFGNFIENWIVKDGELEKFIVPSMMASGMGLNVIEKSSDRTKAVIEDLKLWRLKSFGTAVRFMNEKRTKRLVTIQAGVKLLASPGARVNYKSVREAFQPIGSEKAPYLVIALPKPVVAPGGMGDGKAYAAIGKLRHTANTVIVLVGTHTLGGLKIIDFGRYTTH